MRFLVAKERHNHQHYCDSVPALSWPAISSWLLGILVAFASSDGAIRLTTIPAGDSFLSAMLINVLLMVFKKDGRTVPACRLDNDHIMISLAARLGG
ncbi:hypothetical protein [Dasania marina]|uniref:hypothetical protein n=1 Tax=Dasania marina TaxID=471499 RepID=UPI00036DE12D|nr:hypothetical protein [Dasania marina]